MYGPWWARETARTGTSDHDANRLSPWRRDLSSGQRRENHRPRVQRPRWVGQGLRPGGLAAVARTGGGLSAWHRGRAGNDFGLGAVQVNQVTPDTWVANMVAQRGIRTGSGGPPVRYDAVGKCLAQVAMKAIELGASVHMPRIGCGLAGGTWEKVEPIILSEFSEKDVAVYVYDFG